MVSGFAKNDSILSVSLSCGFMSSAGFFTTSSVRSLSKISGKLAEDASESIAKKSLLSEGVSLLGLTVPVLDVIDLIAWASLVVSAF